MSRRSQPLSAGAPARRPSKLGRDMEQAKIDRARRMAPEERLLIALELSDLCLTLSPACSIEP
ncbi:MAG: hypothetical protein HY208_06740 [Nitrospirae bacterium]|nr:hypothetical protein [Nitrospirota bacterium]